MEGLVVPTRECQDHWGQVRALFVCPLHWATNVSIWDRHHFQVSVECSIGALPGAHSFRRCDIPPSALVCTMSALFLVDVAAVGAFLEGVTDGFDAETPMLQVVVVALVSEKFAVT